MSATVQNKVTMVTYFGANCLSKMITNSETFNIYVRIDNHWEIFNVNDFTNHCLYYCMYYNILLC